MPQSEFKIIEWMWTIITIPISWLWHRNNQIDTRISKIQTDQASIKTDVEVIKTHGAYIKQAIDELKAANGLIKRYTDTDEN